jgi:hypothetical protein
VAKKCFVDQARLSGLGFCQFGLPNEWIPLQHCSAGTFSARHRSSRTCASQAHTLSYGTVQAGMVLTVWVKPWIPFRSSPNVEHHVEIDDLGAV